MPETTPAKVVNCKRCWHPTYDCTVDGFKIQAHTVPLSLPGQIAALKAKRWLYEVIIPRQVVGGKIELRHYRVHADREPIAVVTTHLCEPMPQEFIDPVAAAILDAFHNPPKPPALFEPPF